MTRPPRSDASKALWARLIADQRAERAKNDAPGPPSKPPPPNVIPARKTAVAKAEPPSTPMRETIASRAARTAASAAAYDLAREREREKARIKDRERRAAREAAGKDDDDDGDDD